MREIRLTGAHRWGIAERFFGPAEIQLLVQVEVEIQPVYSYGSKPFKQMKWRPITIADLDFIKVKVNPPNQEQP